MAPPTSPSTARSRRAAAALLAIVTALALAAPAAVAGPTDRPGTAAALAGGWVARLVAGDGAVAEGFSGPVGNATQAALALAASGVGADAFTRATAYVAANVEEFTGPCPAEGDAQADPGALGYVLLLADAAGADPGSFGGEDLVACLQATRRGEDQADTGLYGSSDPTNDGTFRQSLALLGLHAAGAEPHASAVQWLVDQQCDTGGWPSYRDPSAPCAPLEGVFDPTAPNTNSTGLATQALVALGEQPTADPAVYLAGAQNEDGGFGWDAATATDAQSTALAIQAIVALGGDPTAGGWQQEDGDTPLTALLALQIGCDAAGPARGAFAYQPGEGGELLPNAAATFQAAWGAARAPLPFGTVDLADDEPFPACPLRLVRQAGDTRTGTAVAIAAASHPDGADTVVIAHAHGYADSLAGAPLARQVQAPILLSDRDRLPDQVAEAIDDLGASTAILLGGQEALSSRVEEDLRERTGVEDVKRIAGSDRFDTAARIAERVGGDHVHVVEGIDPHPSRGWPDALAVSPLAAHEQRPILLVTTEAVPPPTREALEGRAGATIVGGEVAVSAAVEATVDELAGEVSRLAGATRYDTALAVAGAARRAGMDPATTWFATGRRFPDALAAGPAVAGAGAVLMLVDGQDLDGSPATERYLERVDHTLDQLVFVGGPAAVTPQVAQAIVDAARAEALR